MSTLTREMLESVFAPEELLTAPQSILGPVANADAAEVLSTLGIPHWENPWFDMDDKIGTRLEPITDWDWRLPDRYEHIPPGADHWIGLGLVPYDDLAFDPATGEVFCLPDDAEIYRINSSLRAFVHFHYLLKSTKPEWDFNGSRTADPEMLRLRLREAMAEVDRSALEIPDSCWPRLLDHIVNPEVL
ncbi:SUKH-4 family immunity protein [Streptomyces cocklensis]|jgi:hypothetical protein|uniref:SUKH-4 immunity protein n=1 Tax=Actinacidiphila cocklensis TaxID=887465 RepID=A0A9W4E2C0_9ACTN|nr:SUKH-4 family immunity protein [Actinacidiphila cocklensis]MDD1056709.1 SUKH-4 family immunity protein [Actinacidiphila cocklensis]CAG6397819.1 conserved hypothetical protein [Actinacidiphila cocklensis]